jgi:hypothetical protein
MIAGKCPREGPGPFALRGEGAEDGRTIRDEGMPQAVGKGLGTAQEAVAASSHARVTPESARR